MNNACTQRQIRKQIQILVLNRKANLTKSVIFNQVEYDDDRNTVNKFNIFFIIYL